MTDKALTRQLIILGIRGVPAAHGGFETFAEYLAIYLQKRGWDVLVYCQGSPTGTRLEDSWEGIRRIHIPTTRDGAIGTIEFDIKSTADALRNPGTILTLGYNTGFLCSWMAAKGRTNLINMDGLEWKRAKYSRAQQAFLWVNERLAAAAGTHLIADHPAIADHLARKTPRERITMIPYGSERIDKNETAPLETFGIEPGRFFTVIARPEPENSVLEIVRGFSAKLRGVKLMLLGKYDRSHAYQAAVMDAAGPEVMLPGAIYDKTVLRALRYHSLAYIHGHQVGGTNPSLVEALGAANAVIAHDNPFNRWVCGNAGMYFNTSDDCSHAIDRVLTDPMLVQQMRDAARAQWNEKFTWPSVLGQYETLLTKYHYRDA